MSALEDGLKAALAKAKAETTVIGSVQVFIQGLKDQVTSLIAQLAAAGASEEQLAMVQELNDTLDANAAGLAVVENTPAAPVTDTPPPTE